MRNIFQKKYNFPTIFIVFGLFFSFVLFLSIPTTYDYAKLENKLLDTIESNFSFKIKNIDNISYRFVPSPHLTMENSELFLSENINSKITNLKNLKIYISLIDLYKKEINIKKISITNSNFEIDNKRLQLIISHINSKKINNLTIKNSKFFYNTAKGETSIISPIKNFKYFTNFKSNQKNLNIDGNIFDTDYVFRWKKLLKNEHQSNFSLKFKSPKILFQNNLDLDNQNQKIGELSSTFLNYKFIVNYLYDDKNITLNIKDNPNYFFSLDSNISLDPFYFEANTNLKKQKINELIEILLTYYFNNKGKLHPNLNGKLNVNLENIENAYLNSGLLNFNFYNSDVKLTSNFLNIRKIGKIKSVDHFFYNNGQSTIFASNLEITIENQEEFYRRFLVPKKNRVKINKIYLILEKDIYKDTYSISNFFLNKKTDFIFDEIGLSSVEKKYFDNFQKFRNIIIDEFKNIN